MEQRKSIWKNPIFISLFSVFVIVIIIVAVVIGKDTNLINRFEGFFSNKSSGTISQAQDVPTEAKLHLQQGMNYVNLKDYENAIKEFTLAIDNFSKYAAAYSSRAVAYIQQGKFNKAQDDLKKASELNPKDPVIFYNLTALFSLQNNLDYSLDNLDKTLELGFNDYDKLRGDSDLSNVRNHPEFRKILEKHKVFLK